MIVVESRLSEKDLVETYNFLSNESSAPKSLSELVRSCVSGFAQALRDNGLVDELDEEGAKLAFAQLNLNQKSRVLKSRKLYLQSSQKSLKGFDKDFGIAAKIAEDLHKESLKNSDELTKPKKKE